MSVTPALGALVLGLFPYLDSLAARLARPPQEPETAAARPPAPAGHLTVDDIVLQESARGFELSRDGRRALWLRLRPDKEKDRHLPTLMLTELATGEHRELTVGQDSVGAPRFSPSGDRIAFLSDRKLPAGSKELPEGEKGSQIWLLDLRGGEARPITRIPFGVRSFRWQDEDNLVLTARDRHSRAEARRHQEKDKTIAYEDTDEFADGAVRLFRLELKSKKLFRLTTNRDRITTFEVSPDGRWIVALHAVHPAHGAEGRFPPRCVLHDLRQMESPREQELFADRRNKPRGFHWRLDGSGFFVTLPHSSVDGEDEAAITVLAEVTVPEGAVRMVDLQWPRGLAGDLAVRADGFVASLQDGMRPRWFRYVRDGGVWARTELEGARPHDLVVARDADAVLFVRGSASEPDTVMAGTLRGTVLGDQREFYRPNEGFRGKRLARTEILRWRGALDEEVEGLLYWPDDYRQGQRRPLVLITHGGPHGADRDRFSERWSNSPNLYTQRGAFVLKTNYHGSSSYGLEFGESIKGRYYELELQDLFAGIQMLIDRGLVDRERLGLVGWSNGAILSVAALTHGDVYAPGYDFTFKACAPGAGDVNWTSDYGNCAFGASFDEFYLGAAPWEDEDLYVRKSPLFHMEKVTTPTILFFGTEDTNVPTEQGYEHYRAMHRIGRAPVRFLLFPGEPHGLRKLTHQRRKLQEELAWMDRYLFGVQPSGPDLVVAGSPLDVARRKSRFGRDGDRYGVLQNGVLVPETVPLGAVRVGRFEVTAAQFAQFRPGAAGGDPNLPAVMEAADAAAYIAWLRQKTGEPWRLLTAAEFDALPTGKEENTLDWWAGYPPSLEDAVALAAMVKAQPGGGLLPVGSRPPGLLGKGERAEPLFDAGGNVAEWVQGKDGPELRGGCAVCSSDERRAGAAAPAGYRGLRLALGPVPVPDKAR